jgi:hypothetical protein
VGEFDLGLSPRMDICAEYGIDPRIDTKVRNDFFGIRVILVGVDSGANALFTKRFQDFKAPRVSPHTF